MRYIHTLEEKKFKEEKEKEKLAEYKEINLLLQEAAASLFLCAALCNNE